MSKDDYMFENYINLAHSSRINRDYAKALRFYMKAYKCEHGRQDTELILDIALLYSELQYYEEAEEKFKEIICFSPEEPRAYYGLGVVYDEQGDYNRAIELYKKATELDENYDRAYFFLANAYDEIGNIEKAVDAYKKVIILKPDDFWAHINLAVIYREKGNFTAAVKTISEGIDNNPEEGFLYYNRACFYVHIDLHHEALHDVIKAEECNDFFEQYMIEDEELNPIRLLPEYKSRFE